MVETAREYLDLVRQLPDVLQEGGADPQSAMAPLVEACATLRANYGATAEAVIDHARPTAQDVIRRAPITARRLVGDWLVMRVCRKALDSLATKMWLEERRSHHELGAGQVPEAPWAFAVEQDQALLSLLGPTPESPVRSSGPSLTEVVSRARELGTHQDSCSFVLLISDTRSSLSDWTALFESCTLDRIRWAAGIACARLMAEAGECSQAAQVLLSAVRNRLTPLATYNLALYAARAGDLHLLHQARVAYEEVLPSGWDFHEAAIAQWRRDENYWRRAFASSQRLASALTPLLPAFMFHDPLEETGQ